MRRSSLGTIASLTARPMRSMTAAITRSFGRVLRFIHDPDGRPLLYFRGSYGKSPPLAGRTISYQYVAAAAGHDGAPERFRCYMIQPSVLK